MDKATSARLAAYSLWQEKENKLTQLAKLSEGKTLRKAIELYESIAPLDAFPKDVVQDLGQAILKRDVAQIALLSNQIALLVEGLQKKNAKARGEQ